MPHIRILPNFKSFRISLQPPTDFWIWMQCEAPSYESMGRTTSYDECFRGEGNKALCQKRKSCIKKFTTS